MDEKVYDAVREVVKTQILKDFRKYVAKKNPKLRLKQPGTHKKIIEYNSLSGGKKYLLELPLSLKKGGYCVVRPGKNFKSAQVEVFKK